jgi:hypothetical protein
MEVRYVLVHTSFVSANDILVTFVGMIVASPPDPKIKIGSKKAKSSSSSFN